MRAVRESQRDAYSVKYSQGVANLRAFRVLERQLRSVTTASVLCQSLFSRAALPLAPELVLPLGKAHGLVHAAVEALEHIRERRGEEAATAALLDAYEAVGDADAAQGLLCVAARSGFTAQALECERRAQWDDARRWYRLAMAKVGGPPACAD
jgi:hypothetical protein